MERHNIHVPNHQPDYYEHVYIHVCVCLLSNYHCCYGLLILLHMITIISAVVVIIMHLIVIMVIMVIV